MNPLECVCRKFVRTYIYSQYLRCMCAFCYLRDGSSPVLPQQSLATPGGGQGNEEDFGPQQSEGLYLLCFGKDNYTYIIKADWHGQDFAG